MDSEDRIDQFNDPVRYREGDLPETAAESVVPYIPFGLRQAKITDIRTRTDLIRELTKQIPSNEYNLPQYYYRPDMLDKDMLLRMMEQQQASYVDQMLQVAIYPISYGQGFPTQKDGNPIWGQMPWETKESYDGFTQYLELEGIRSLAAITSLPLEVTSAWFDINYWSSRAKAFDIFKAAHHARIRENRIMRLENDHWRYGEQIMAKLYKAIDGKTAEELAELEVDKLISSLERVSRIQRSAVGLSQTGKGAEGDSPKVSSVEVVMRNIAGDQAKPIESDAFDTSLLADPELLKQAQELIIRVNK